MISVFLIDLLIRELRSDAIKKNSTLQEISVNTWQVMRILSSVEIFFNFRINKGPEKLNPFQNFNIPILLPLYSQNKEILSDIWQKFMELIDD